MISLKTHIKKNPKIQSDNGLKISLVKLSLGDVLRIFLRVIFLHIRKNTQWSYMLFKQKNTTGREKSSHLTSLKASQVTLDLEGLQRSHLEIYKDGWQYLQFQAP